MAARGRGQRMSTAARSTPYARPTGDSRMTSRDAWEHDAFADEAPREQAAWPPAQVSIRGASGPTWIVVGNLVLGTSVEDIQETFQQFGEIAQVLRREPPGPNHPSCSFDVGFVQRSSAEAAIKTLDKALADGRLLSVDFSRSPPATAEARMLRAAGVDYQANGGANVRPVPVGAPPIVQRPSPAAPPSVPAHASPIPRAPAHSHAHAAPSGPRFPAHPHAPQHAHARFPPAALHKGKFQAPGKGVPIAPPSLPLQSRLLSVPELRALQKKQARQKAGRAPVHNAPLPLPAGPAGWGAKGNSAPNAPRANAAPSGTGASNLMARLALPLEQRLLGDGGGGGEKGQGGKGKGNKGVLNALQVGSGAPPKSDPTALSASQLKRQRKKLAAQRKAGRTAGGMDVD